MAISQEAQREHDALFPNHDSTLKVMITYASFGGQRASGFGRERGVEGLRLYQQLSCLTLS